MEEIKIKGMEKESKGWITILLIILNIIIWSIIAIIAFFYFNIQKVNAQSQEVNMSAWSWGYSGTDSGAINNGTSTSVNWTTHSQLTTAYINAIFPGANGTSTISYSIATSNKKLCSLVNIYVWEGSNLLSTNPTWTCGQGSNIYFLFISLQLETKANYNYTVQVKFNSVGQIPTSYNLGSTSVTGTIRTELSDDLTNQTYIDGTNNIINNINNVASGIENAIISANKYCQTLRKFKMLKENYILSNNAETPENGNRGISDYLEINENSTYILNYQNNVGVATQYCIYDIDKIVINCEIINRQTSITINNTNGHYIRTTMRKNEWAKLNGTYCQDRTEALLKGNPWDWIHPNRDDFDDMEDIEDNLHTYTNVDLDTITVNLDPDTGSWVWNTLTSLLNTNAMVFGMIISILSIGVVKMILNR